MATGGKQTSPRPAKNRPRHAEHNAPGGPANPFGHGADKAAIVERLRASAQRGQTASTEPGEATEVRSEGES